MTCGRLLGAVVALLATAGCGGTTTTGAGGSCAGPQAVLAPDSAAAGEQVTYTVEWLRTGCRDTDRSDEVVEPLRDVRVEVVQGTGSVVVGTVSGTDARYAGSLAFVLPGWLRPGTAEVVLDTPVPDHLPFTVVPGN